MLVLSHSLLLGFELGVGGFLLRLFWFWLLGVGSFSNVILEKNWLSPNKITTTPLKNKYLAMGKNHRTNVDS